MTKKLAEMEAHKKDLEDRLARASEALDKLAKRGDINLEEVVTGAQKPIDGRVLEVDPVSNVVVINVGKEQGVGLGYSFTVYRNGEYVGEIRVDQLKDDLAGATPVAGTMKSDIRKGDNVTTRIR
jgi:cell shape-determining protein MreC